MNLPLCIASAALLLSILSSNTPTVSSHFFPNISSIPPTLIPNATAWDAFTKLAGCRKGVTYDGLSKIKKYFQRFGYLDASYSNFSNDFDEFLESAVKSYQVNFNLNSTGELDVQTLKRVVLPRCGNPDVVNRRPAAATANGTVAHYSFFEGRPRWPPSRTELTYAFLPENQISDAAKGLYARAFERWSEVTPLTFTEAPAGSFNGADIRIGFFSGDHGDGEPFDGMLGTLAHAFSPPTGRLHMDGDENWVLDGNFLTGAPATAVDLESVAVHEIGHILGLGHSSVEEAIMYPSISSGARKVELANDDILGIQELYGSNPNYNGSGPGLTPRGESDTSGVGHVGCQLLGLLVLLLLLFLFIA